MHTLQARGLGTLLTLWTTRTQNNVWISLQGFLNMGPQMPEPEYLLKESRMCTQTAFLSTSTVGKYIYLKEMLFKFSPESYSKQHGIHERVQARSNSTRSWRLNSQRRKQNKMDSNTSKEKRNCWNGFHSKCLHQVCHSYPLIQPKKAI